MIDEPNQAATPDTGTQPEPEAPKAPEQGTPEGTPEVNWAEEGPRYQQRYDDLRPQWDRTNALLDRARQGDQEAAAELGFEFVDPDEDDGLYGGDDEYVDPDEELRQKVEAMEAYLSQGAEAQQQLADQEQEFSYIDDQLASVEKETGKQLSDEEAEVVGTLALQMRDERGAPDVKGAYERIYQTVLEKERGRWVDSKKRAPQVRAGSQAEGQPNLDDPDPAVRRQNRRDFMAARLEQEQ